MVDVLRVNLHRMRALWPAFHAHVSALLADGRPPVRAAAVDALGRALGAALATSPRPRALENPGSKPPKPARLGAPVLADGRGARAAAEDNGSAVAAEDPADAQAAEQDDPLADGFGGAAGAALGGAGVAAEEGLQPELQGPVLEAAAGGLDDGAEEMLLEALRGLYAGAREPDVRLGLLRVLLQVLQRHGAPHADSCQAGMLHCHLHVSKGCVRRGCCKLLAYTASPRELSALFLVSCAQERLISSRSGQVESACCCTSCSDASCLAPRLQCTGCHMLHCKRNDFCVFCWMYSLHNELRRHACVVAVEHWGYATRVILLQHSPFAAVLCYLTNAAITLG